MRHGLLAATVVFGLGFAGCTCSSPGTTTAAAGTTPALSPEEALAADARRVLAERDGRLRSYHFAADSSEAGQEAHHEFTFRAPNKMHGVVTKPVPGELSFDGAFIYRLVTPEKRLEVLELKMSAANGSSFLNSSFAPFVPEGFRAPLLPTRDVTATLVDHPRGPRAWRLSLVARGEENQAVEVAYLLRHPTGDFLGKTVTSSTSVEETVVVEEHCDDDLRLCVPKKVVHRADGKDVATEVYGDIRLNPDVSTEAFVVPPPAGFTVTRKRLGDAAP